MGSMLVTVFGGSGFVGRYVVQKLCAAGHRVRVAVRNPNRAMYLKPMGAVGQVQLMQANVRHAGSVATAVAGADAVINLVGILFESGHQNFNEVQRDGAMLVARQAAAAGVRQFVQLSAIGADADSEADYARTKGEAEAGVRSALPQAVILRPSVIFGAEDGLFNRFAGMARWPMPVMPVVAGTSRFQPVHVLDVAEAVMAALDGRAAAGTTYELGGPRVWSMREILAYVLAEVQSKKPLVDVPMPVARVQATMLGLLPNPLLTSDQLKMLATDNVVGDGMPGLAALGLAATPVEAIVPQYLRRYRPHGQFSRDAAA
jgi:uncharacterized protein YbjT (DUF2867 family)